MSDDHPPAVVRALYRASSTPGLTTDLTSMSAEQAATALVDEFARTGYAEARVVDVKSVRSLARTDCRRRGLRFRSLEVAGTVAMFDERRHDSWLETDEGKQHQRCANQVIIAALEEKFR